MAKRKYRVSTLQKRLERYKEQLYQETIKPCGNWGDGMRLSKLSSITKWERLKDKVKETEKLLQDAIKEGRYQTPIKTQF